jgi:hypothetical protein
MNLSRIKRMAAASVLLALLAVPVAACGAGSSPSGPAVTPTGTEIKMPGGFDNVVRECVDGNGVYVSEHGSVFVAQDDTVCSPRQ